MSQVLLSLFVLSLFIKPSFSKDNTKLNITEEKILEIINEKNPSIEEINLSIESKILEKTQNDENFSPKLQFERKNQRSDYLDNNNQRQKSSNDFYSASINKKTKRGVKLGIGAANNFFGIPNFEFTSDQRFYKENAYIDITIDLWKDFLGYTSYNEDKSLNLSIAEEKINAEIKKQRFLSNVRSIYWQIVENHRKLEIYEEILKKAEKLEANTKEKYKLSIADKGDVARSSSFTENMRANLLNTEYQIENQKQSLNNLIPELNDINMKDISFDFQKTKDEVVSCIVNISQVQDKMQYTKYDELISLKEQRTEAQIKSLKRYSDLELEGYITASSHSDNAVRSDAYEEIGDIDNKNTFAGIRGSYNFGSADNKSKENSIKIQKMYLRMEKGNILASLDSLHNYFINTVEVLKNALESSKNNTKYQMEKTSYINKKYKQGRETLDNVINDETDLLNSEINKIAIEHQMIYLVLDYISVYGDTPCQFSTKP